MFCENCGIKIEKDGKFCKNCGWKVPDSNLNKNPSFISPPAVKTNVLLSGVTSKGRCTNCDRPIEQDWLVCPYCKVEIIFERFCESCGNKLETGWLICPFCKTEV